MKKTLNRKVILITGKNGFIGRNLSELILSKYKDYFKIIDYRKKYIRNYTYDFIIHLAFSHNDNMKKTNINITKEVLKLAIRDKSKIIYLSSSSVYGKKSKNLPIKENFRLNAINNYGRVKIDIENLLRKNARKHKIHILGLRVFNVVGKYQNNEFLIPQIINKLKNKEILEIQNPYHKRDYISADYLSIIIMKILFLDKDHYFKILNLGSGKSYFIYQIVNKLVKIYNFDKKNINYIKNKDLNFSLSCNDKLNRYLDIDNKFNLYDYLNKNKGIF